MHPTIALSIVTVEYNITDESGRFNTKGKKEMVGENIGNYNPISISNIWSNERGVGRSSCDDGIYLSLKVTISS